MPVISFPHKKFLLKVLESLLFQMCKAGEILEKGVNATITTDKVEQTAAYYRIGGMSEKEAYAEAVDYARKREALYQEALRN